MSDVVRRSCARHSCLRRDRGGPRRDRFATADTPDIVRDLATNGAHLVAEESELLTIAGADGLSPADLARRARPAHRGRTSHRDHAAARSARRRPVEHDSRRHGAAPPAGHRLGRYAAPVATASRRVRRRHRGPDAHRCHPCRGRPDYKRGRWRHDVGLLAVGATALLAVGLAALANTLRRADDDEDLAAMAWSDGLTGVANRRRLDRDIAANAAGSSDGRDHG